MDYFLLKYHANKSTDYLLYHCKMLGLLANKDPRVDTFDKYDEMCETLGIVGASEKTYDAFMQETAPAICKLHSR